MPWGIRKRGGTWEIIRTDTGELVGHSKTRAKALASIRHREKAVGLKEFKKHIT